MTFDYAATAKRVTSREVAAARLAPDYAALVAHFGLTSDTKAEDITSAARKVVIDGASRTLTEADLTGRDPGDVPTRPFWKAARAVRIGLVTAIGGDKDTSDTDWLKLVKQATENAAKHEISVDAILAAVRETLKVEDNDES